VIHDFYVPAFRTKTDVLPGKYTTEWFRPTKTGAYHIFCAEYCGTKHSGMIGTVYVMSQADYNTWLGQGSGEGSMAEQGQSLFNQLGCGTCHASPLNRETGRCPNLNGLFGSTVELKDGTKVKADEAYIRESILYPQAKIVGGYDDIMPTFKGLITEDGLLKVVEYIKSLGPAGGQPAGSSAAPPAPTETSATEQAQTPNRGGAANAANGGRR